MVNSIEQEVVRQSQNIQVGSFRCVLCKNYLGTYGCKKGVFIAFVGGNLSACCYFELGRKCPHCGRII